MEAEREAKLIEAVILLRDAVALMSWGMQGQVKQLLGDCVVLLVDLKSPPARDELTAEGYKAEWRCSCCGEINDDVTTGAWRWNGFAWEHKCPTIDAQAGHQPCKRVDARYKSQSPPGDEAVEAIIEKYTASNDPHYDTDVVIREAFAEGRALALTELRGKVEQTIRMLADRDILRPIDLLRDFAAKLLGESK